MSAPVPGNLTPPDSTPTPRSLQLPATGKTHPVYTREHMTMLYHCSHGELGRMLSRNMAPLPIRVDGAILWYVDEALASMAQVLRTLERWRKNR